MKPLLSRLGWQSGKQGSGDYKKLLFIEDFIWLSTVASLDSTERMQTCHSVWSEIACQKAGYSPGYQPAMRHIKPILLHSILQKYQKMSHGVDYPPSYFYCIIEQGLSLLAN